MPLMAETLAAGRSVRLSPRGVSMLPMLRQGRDSVVLSPITGRLKRYDLPLYRRDNGQYVLHRVVRAGESYTCMGDNQFVPEPGLRHEQMLAVVTAFTRGGREYSTANVGYRLYCRVWCAVRPVRRLFRRAAGVALRCARRVRAKVTRRGRQ